MCIWAVAMRIIGFFLGHSSDFMMLSRFLGYFRVIGKAIDYCINRFSYFMFNMRGFIGRFFYGGNNKDQ
ncbi:hypothetical protein HUT03_00415 [Candidatus Liberibacter africanus]|uniref:Uncharacterized protein n=1 Tax=Candidatus Liberibacter africanus PTSAPSY TaxID=1277257 RepID=A0A0G3I3B8_LIBAF|nr:hypothetical protein [Candidatus Liberibacter africanus]AKK19740.1 hypothetical protein G293_00450 [Candidatus Liberibacter africanus PTSAPSY]QTP63620.1 hypothetical protein HUT03_00415 [Candidatus Liberibacter africanus]